MFYICFMYPFVPVCRNTGDRPRPLFGSLWRKFILWWGASVRLHKISWIFTVLSHMHAPTLNTNTLSHAHTHTHTRYHACCQVQNIFFFCRWSIKERDLEVGCCSLSFDIGPDHSRLTFTVTFLRHTITPHSARGTVIRHGLPFNFFFCFVISSINLVDDSMKCSTDLAWLNPNYGTKRIEAGASPIGTSGPSISCFTFQLPYQFLLFQLFMKHSLVYFCNQFFLLWLLCVAQCVVTSTHGRGYQKKGKKNTNNNE